MQSTTKSTKPEIISTPYRFSSAIMFKYFSFIFNALAHERRVIIFGTPDVRLKIQTVFSDFLTKGSMDKIEVRAYPNSRAAALNLGRGMSGLSAILIDDNGRYTDDIVKSIGSVDGANVMIVSH